ncbi:hypothetical protein B0T16DRAFT_461999 [Cercophora newfieldiana]|uniref:Uncharacterized protein n=1 Tax=Cercophora newfieldiana TaxID=92897 RepID=A0AA40CLM6_9PEZI|nr:hypothetical protein B0T16DRAFT_461999 [Cercophora newfieldiana]
MGKSEDTSALPPFSLESPASGITPSMPFASAPPPPALGHPKTPQDSVSSIRHRIASSPLVFEVTGSACSSKIYRLPDPKLVQAVYKKKLENCGDLVSQMIADVQRPFNTTSTRGRSNTTFHFEKHYEWVLMKQQNMWFPDLTLDNNTVTLKTLYEIGHTISNADRICRHLSWAQEYHYLVPQMRNFPPKRYRFPKVWDQALRYVLPIGDMGNETEPLPDVVTDIDERLRCALLHKVGCRCLAGVHWGAVKSCPICYTDYAFNVVPCATNFSGRVFVFTSWKCLGRGTRNWFYWSTHTDASNCPGRDRSPGGVYSGCELEEERSSGTHWCIYTPRLDI